LCSFIIFGVPTLEDALALAYPSVENLFPNRMVPFPLVGMFPLKAYPTVLRVITSWARESVLYPDLPHCPSVLVYVASLPFRVFVSILPPLFLEILSRTLTCPYGDFQKKLFFWSHFCPKKSYALTQTEEFFLDPLFPLRLCVTSPSPVDHSVRRFQFATPRSRASLARFFWTLPFS